MSDVRCSLRSMLVATLVITSILAIAPAWAADAVGANAAVSANADAEGLQEIVVTAEKRAEPSQTVPISLAVFTGHDLEARDVQVLADVAKFTPSIIIDQAASASGGNDSSSIYVRGLGQSDPSGFADPAVGLYLDGVYFGRSVGSMADMIDLDRVEILKGPQGTLFGKNTMGGAVSLFSAMPTNQFGGWAEASYGSFNEHDFKAMINLPLIGDQLAARFTVSDRNRDGYTDSLINGEKQDSVDSVVARGIVLWTPNSDIKLTTIADYHDSNETIQGFHLVTAQLDPALPPGGILSIYNTLPIAAPATPYQAFDARWISAGRNFNYAVGPAAGGPLGLCNCNKINGQGISETLNWAITAGLNFTSITAYRGQNSAINTNLTGSPLDFQANGNRSRQGQFSEELRLDGSAFDDRLKWLMGGYFFREHINEILNVQIGWAGELQALGLQNHVWPTTTTKALFTQETYNFTDKFSITAGVRYNEDTKLVTADSFDVLANDYLLPPLTKRQSWPSWTPRFSAQYQATPQALLYTSYSEGFKSGGYDYDISSDAFLPYGPEKVTAYETGFKTTWLGNRLRFNGAAYYNDYRDIALPATTLPGTFSCPATVLPSCSEIVNQSTAHIKGAELDLTAVPASGFQVFASLGFLDDKLVQINPILIASGSTIPDAVLPRTPRWTASVGAQYSLNLNGYGNLSLRADYAYKSLEFFDFTDNAATAQGGYGLLDSRLAFDSADDHWELAVSATNLTNKLYINAAYFTTAFNFASVHYGAPRIVLGTVRYRF